MGTYTTVSKVSAELKGFTIDGSSTPSSSEVDSWITEAESDIDYLTNNVYASTAISSEVYDWDNVGDNIFRTNYSPLITVTSLEYNSSNFGETASWTALTEGEDEDFYVYKEQGEIIFVPKNFSPVSGKNRFRLTGTYGLSSVPGRIQHLATMMVARRVIGAVINNQSTDGGGNVSVGTISVTEPGVFTVNRFDQLGKEIDTMVPKLAGTFKTHRVKRVY